MTNQTQKALSILFGIVLMILWLSISDDDYQHELDELKEACDMHRIWLDGAYARVPKEKRDGWAITVQEYETKCGGV